jgi:hypothetical protein
MYEPFEKLYFVNMMDPFEINLLANQYIALFVCVLAFATSFDRRINFKRRSNNILHRISGSMRFLKITESKKVLS